MPYGGLYSNESNFAMDEMFHNFHNGFDGTLNHTEINNSSIKKNTFDQRKHQNLRRDASNSRHGNQSRTQESIIKGYNRSMKQKELDALKHPSAGNSVYGKSMKMSNKVLKNNKSMSVKKEL